MRWPPVKAWTSATLRKGFRHFVAINYGGTQNERWVLLVSVLDGDARLIVKWSEINDQDKWVSGWSSLSRDESNPISNASFSRDNHTDSICLHPSRDSGLLIPSETIEIRPWD